MKKRGVKAQVSIFLILAIILVIAIGLLIALYSLGIIRMQQSLLPEKFLPVQEYVEKCLARASVEAVDLVGVQGGYVYVPERIKNNPETHLRIYRDFILPYWYYNFQPNVPTNKQIQNQMASYIADRVDKCVADFGPLNDMYNIKAVGEPEVKVAIKENSVDVYLEYPLEVSLNRAFRRITEFKANVPVRLGKVLRLARALMEAENRDAFFEQRTIDLMAMAPDSKVPFTNIEFSCLPRTWLVEDVKNFTQKLLKYNVPKVRVGKTNFEPFEEPIGFYKNVQAAGKLPSDTTDFVLFYWEPLNELFPDMRVGFSYNPKWGIEFKVHPSSSGIMRSVTAKGGDFDVVNLAFMCIQLYHFTYDIRYPVKATIFDSRSMGDRGYAFSFAFPVNVVHNAGLRKYKPMREFEIYEPENFCNELSNEKYSIIAKDTRNYSLIKNVSVAFNCIHYKCHLGNTTEEGRLLTELPEGCYGGFVVLEKNGYLRTEQQISDEQTIVVYMMPLRYVNVSVLKFDNSTGEYSELADDEKAAVYMTLEKGDQELYALYTKGNPQQIGLVNDNVIYKLSVYFFKNDKLVGGYVGDYEIQPSELQFANKLELYTYQFPYLDEGDVIQAINYYANSTELKPRLR